MWHNVVLALRQYLADTDLLCWNSKCLVRYLFPIVLFEVNNGVIGERFPRTTEQITVATS